MNLTKYILIALFLNQANCLIRRCFKCSSRSELGTCGDPFGSNATVHGVKLDSCQSGWCAKIIKGSTGVYRTDDYGISTSRMCLKEGPSDGEERCGPVMLSHKKVFMCFCNGDLCNSANKLPTSFLIFLPTILMTFTLYL